MENFKKTFERQLNNLDIDIKSTDNISEKFVSLKFKRKALKVHSDKTGKDDEEFKQLLHDYHEILDALKKLNVANEEEEKDELQSFLKSTILQRSFRKVGQCLWKRKK